ncbi:Sodium/hydrogen exchanger [Fasciolopsis buskii]|uniref:Sodium/hydrogen exchanger n=1 Tax=Fasciolopsis buskii TaxID=27845 RepID=A0A8E0RNL3_9TREM|nr:Sodium/hydrogen exchanger [Fasciolopsis buski]
MYNIETDARFRYHILHLIIRTTFACAIFVGALVLRPKNTSETPSHMNVMPGNIRSVVNVEFLLSLLLLPLLLIGVPVEGSDHSTGTNSSDPGIVAATWHFHEYSVHITIMAFLICMVLIKVLFHRLPHVSRYVPESLLLIIMGLIFGVAVRTEIREHDNESSSWQLTPELFFIYLLPPIVLEASYSLYNRTFSEYLGIVLLFAVLGTIINFVLIGFAMYGLYKSGAFGAPAIDVDLKTMLLFSSLIVAVDPVAVLAIFQEIGVELSLYYIVFGESLLNDAITVVLYQIMSAFVGQEYVSLKDIGIGVASFITVSLGGLLIGVLIGIISCLFTRIRSHLGAFILIVMAYFSYIITHCVGWSGIIAMIGCGLVQAAYAFHNLDQQSVTLVHHLTKIVAEVSESVIFLFLGVAMLSENLVWHTGFMLWALVLCLIARAVVIFGLTAIINYVNVDGTKLSIRKQLVLIYGGLRGAVAFSLAVLVQPQRLGEFGHYNRQMIITAALFITMFTVGVMGVTMKPLVRLLHITLQPPKTLSLFGVLNGNVMDELLAGVEVILGFTGRNRLRTFLMHLDEKYIRRILQNEPETYDQRLMKTYRELAMKLHFAALQPQHCEQILREVPEALKRHFLLDSTARLSDSSAYLNNAHELNDCMRMQRLVQLDETGRRQLGFQDQIRRAHAIRTRDLTGGGLNVSENKKIMLSVLGGLQPRLANDGRLSFEVLNYDVYYDDDDEMEKGNLQ